MRRISHGQILHICILKFVTRLIHLQNLRDICWHLCTYTCNVEPRRIHIAIVSFEYPCNRRCKAKRIAVWISVYIEIKLCHCCALMLRRFAGIGILEYVGCVYTMYKSGQTLIVWITRCLWISCTNVLKWLLIYFHFEGKNYNYQFDCFIISNRIINRINFTLLPSLRFHVNFPSTLNILFHLEILAYQILAWNYIPISSLPLSTSTLHYLDYHRRAPTNFTRSYSLLLQRLQASKWERLESEEN